MTTQTTETFAEIGIPINPFPGLRPFEFDESHLFFGRDGQSEQLIGKLGRTHFLAVVGTSGSGKSSLVRAGLLPSILGGFMTGAGSSWRIAVMRPGNDPIGNLARALNAPDVFGSENEENAALQTALAEAALQRGSRGLVDAVRQAVVTENENLLVVVDQFEEIFRFARVAEGKEYQNEAAAFVKLILEASRQREIPIYAVLTMRSDYLGDCSQFWGLPEAINESQYLIPRPTRDHLRETITGPIAVARGEITQRLIARLLNDVGDDQDQLPVLQHLLMRLWDESKEQRLEVEEREEGAVRKPHKEVHSGPAIDLCCYEAVGGMTEALSHHADEAFNELPDSRHQEVAEKLFKALTEKGSDNREIRRPVTLGEICAMAAASATEVIAVIEKFRHPRKSFLMPPAGVALNAESLIDISHESLIRGWSRLKDWVDEEARSARIYRRLAETAVLHKEGRAGLWRDPDLQIALTWREKSKPNQIWAQRYHREFDEAMSFLDDSVTDRDTETLNKETQRRRAIKRTRWTATMFAFLFLVSLVALVVANQQRVRANGLLEDVKRNSEAAKTNAVREEKARFATQLAENARQESEDARKTSDMRAAEARKLQGLADSQRKEALKQKGIAEQQALKVAKLERQARQEATEAQEINSLTREVNDELASSNAEGVISKASKQLEYYRKRGDARGEYESQTILGPAYLKQGEHAEARASAENALAIQEKQQINNQRGEHENLTVLREAYLKEADLKEGKSGEQPLLDAFRTALRALKVQEGSIGANNSGLFPDLNSLALVSERRGEHDTSEGFRLRIVDIQKKTLQADNAELVTYLNDLATFNRVHGDYAKAEARLKEVLAIQENILAANDPQVVATLNSLVALYRYEKKDAEADLLVKRIQGLQGNAALLQKGSSGPEVKKLQRQLQRLGMYEGTPDEYFGESTEAAVVKFQNSQGLVADGVAGPRTISLLEQPKTAQIGPMEIQTQLQTLGFYDGALDGVFGMRSKAALMAFQRSKGLVADGTFSNETLEALGLKMTAKAPSITGKVTVDIVSKMFPGAPIDNIKANLPFVLRALEDAGLSDKDMVLMALSSIRADIGNFTLLSEFKSRFNTSPEGHPFDLYDNRSDLGNLGPPDGERFRGRGYVQLSGRANYGKYGAAIGLGNKLVENPELANEPDVAAKLLASVLKSKEQQLRTALLEGDLKKARRINSGGYSRVNEFVKAFQTGASLLQ
jgi:peptidoglycan hydrolase-like protein with peptidoglycan-binding domain